MKLALITHVPHIHTDERYFAYGPYVKEMNIWFKYADEVLLVAPMTEVPLSAVDLAYNHAAVSFFPVPAFSLLSVKEILKTMVYLPQLFWSTFKVMKKADHIHLRCPGNMGLIGCLVQILFPNKKKTAKYAGNWDPKAKQPWSYRLQKWILSNTFLTRNMKVLVYGEWQHRSKNILPFFTATYREHEKETIQPRDLTKKITFLFAGTLSEGKRALYAVQLIESLYHSGLDVALEIYGEGKERTAIESYLAAGKLQHIVTLQGNQTQETVKKAYQNNHFLILPSQSEGWPKVVAEAMFWGCVPIATAVSCVANMLDDGKRGLILTMNKETDSKNIMTVIRNNQEYQQMITQGVNWSRQYTIDYFEAEIKNIVAG